jgi:hypothetical protein
MLSNLEAGKKDHSPAVLINNLTNAINAKLRNPEFKFFFGDWTIALGPYIYQHLPTADMIDNAVVVFYNASKNIYVVAVSATNYISDYDWVVEDFTVCFTQDWPNSDAPSGTKISLGTYIGVTNILGMPYASVGQSGVNLENYLAGAASAGATLIFTGHSLGGALSPTLAAWLYGNAKNQQTWGNIYVLPTAGATPGNQQFADFFSAQFPPISDGVEVYDIWNKVLRNTLDIVPHAWLASDLKNLPGLYVTANVDVRIELKVIIDGILLMIPHSYVDLPPQYFSGATPTAAILTIKDYFIEAAQQHVEAYLELFGLSEEKGGELLKSNLAAMKEIFVQKYLNAIHRIQLNRPAH